MSGQGAGEGGQTGAGARQRERSPLGAETGGGRTGRLDRAGGEGEGKAGAGPSFRRVRVLVEGRSTQLQGCTYAACAWRGRTPIRGRGTRPSDPGFVGLSAMRSLQPVEFYLVFDYSRA